MELGRAGGVEQAAYELVSAIGGLDTRNAYGILAPRSASWEWEFPACFDARRIYSDAGEPLGESFHASVARHGSASPDFAFDIVHSTCSYIHPELIDFPGVLTIHDLQHLRYPEFFGTAEWEDRERIYRRSAERAKHIICISEFTRQDVHARYGVPLERMTTIWNIPSRAVWEPVAPRIRRKLLAGMGVEAPFLFYPAQSWPHKNHERLLMAFERAAAAMPHDVKLVLTGRPFDPEHRSAELLRQPRLASRVLHLGFRSPLEIRALFHECEALVFPSLFEGFGMPVAEAIIAAKPVACSNVTSLPEIAADAAVLFDPTDVEQMADRMLQVATQPELRASLSAAARRRRHLFSARLSAVKTLAVYGQVYHGLRSAP